MKYAELTRADNLQMSVGQTAIFLWQGFNDQACPGGSYDGLTHEQQVARDALFDGLGQDGVAMSIGYVAMMIDREYARTWAGIDHPGVYVYEIVEVLGNWLATEEGPDPAEFQYGEKRFDAASEKVLAKYDELMKLWIVTDKLTTTPRRQPITITPAPII